MERICVPERIANVMLPCPLKKSDYGKKGRKLLWDLATGMETRRMLQYRPNQCSDVIIYSDLYNNS